MLIRYLSYVYDLDSMCMRAVLDVLQLTPANT
jgi:hypothetical protein